MIDAPVLTQVTARFDGLEVYDVEPAQPGALPDVLGGRPVALIGKWRGEPRGQLVLHGQAAGGDWQQVLPVPAPDADARALRQLWARQRIAQLSDDEALRGGNPQREAITTLGLQYSLLTNYTSFVAVDHRRAGGRRAVDPRRPATGAAAGREQPCGRRAGAEHTRTGGVDRMAGRARTGRRRAGVATPAARGRTGAGTMTMVNALPCRPVRLAAWGWLALHAAALWPHGLWAARRMLDGSDEPLGVAALAALLIWLVRAAPRLRIEPRLSWLAASATLTVAATAAYWLAPPLPAALLAALALAAHLCAWLPARAPRLPLAGLALLALPIVASLQFYAGYPLRVLTAEVSAGLLQAAGLAAERSGAAMTVNGRLVIVDAPCSGVQMAWLAYFAACAVAAFTGLHDGRFVRRLPLVGLWALTGNVLRNSLLVGLEARPQGLANAWHEAIGIAMLVVVVGLTVRVMSPRPGRGAVS